MSSAKPRMFRSIFISDVHLGSKAAKAEFLIDFLRHHDADTIFLVGDIVDGWRLRRSWHWPQAHNDVVQKLLRKARKGSSITYIAGNHDEFARQFQGVHFGGIVVADRAIHETADGRRMLVIHGDQFDTVVHNARWLAYFGDYAYDAAMLINRGVSRFRKVFGMPYWSFSSWAKVKVKKAVNFIGSFQNVLTEEARRSEVDGVICGHIHHAAIETVDSVQYINTGDWVESCTAVVEHFDGRFEILHWAHVMPEAPSAEPVLVPVTFDVLPTKVRAAEAA
ncbi:MAG: UDP-2,3-diacylglucosamine diphosphatase [Aquamicrobium sp.]|uniref:UDP-2,3-diacylglucosamine diphosphatase n=1 Tax=Mesorhizobium sp. Pch-S TaxID=2082387 RepID=UPI0010104F2F|nr:UDP-2,3-diacylglucosamine diphosphatase [Mesorhizobium sp. Pch-S]MBR2692362.1 UDP-2,3-diacylglucosamine diphosphatase [Aquamicrobium sp.]QAZ47583.1 UDP-2,3-diacylglucosamine hydrolase [Mesorhizobium sp. Pch-S]